VRSLPLVAGLAALVLVVIVGLPRCGHRPAAPAVRASWTLTPGVLNPDVTQATIRSTICVHGWTRTIRPPSDYTSRLKLEQIRAYGLGGSPRAFQEDHLISLELGGHPTDPHNLWPEPYPRAADVDAIENELNDAVCSGRMSLDTAQRKESALKHEKG
jgi:hypothetical protein